MKTLKKEIFETVNRSVFSNIVKITSPHRLGIRLVLLSMLLMRLEADASKVDTLQVHSTSINKQIFTLVIKPEKGGATLLSMCYMAIAAIRSEPFRWIFPR
jgi:glyceraldehyde-3-phosphate dehydrogenase/erythrose-4-phosphate dehydrogenase